MTSETGAIQACIQALSSYEPQQIERIWRTVGSYFGVSTNRELGAVESDVTGSRGALSVKDFMLQKNPQSNAERMACLAYYLVSNRGTAEFKTDDLARLNSEAAQLKFSDPIQATKDSVKAGLLISTNGGKRRISAIGERYVELLPDRKAAREALQGASGRRKVRRKVRTSDESVTRT